MDKNKIEEEYIKTEDWDIYSKENRNRSWNLIFKSKKEDQYGHKEYYSKYCIDEIQVKQLLDDISNIMFLKINYVNSGNYKNIVTFNSISKDEYEVMSNPLQYGM